MESAHKKVKRSSPGLGGNNLMSTFDKLPQGDNCCSCLQMIMSYFDLKTLGRFLQTSILKQFDFVNSNGRKVNTMRGNFCSGLFRSLKKKRYQELIEIYYPQCHHRAFIDACKMGNLQDVRSFIHCRTCSCEECLEDLINCLGLDVDMNPHDLDASDSSPIASALLAKQENIARYLLTFTDNIDLTFANVDEMNILHLAVESTYYCGIS